MSVAKVSITRLDNQLGVLRGDNDVLALIGPCTSGTKNAPAKFARAKDITDTYGSEGPVVEEAVWLLETNQVGEIIIVRSDVTTVGGYGTVALTGTGTSVPTGNTGTEPVDEFDVVVTVVTGGTIGVAGITYTYSLDGGRTTSLAQALGTAVFALLPGNVRINFAAGTLVAADVITVRTSMPLWNGTQLGTALDALKVTSLRWDIAQIIGQCTAADVATIQTKATAIEAAERERHFICNVRNPNVGESEATYLAAQTSAFASTVANNVTVCAGDSYVQSAISQRRYRRPSSWAIAGRVMSIDYADDPAEFAKGPLPTSVQIRDDDGNVDRHDEDASPGFDDVRFSTLRTWKDTPGVYINNVRPFSTFGSDYQFIQHARVMNKACATIRAKLRLVASRKTLVNKKTGYLLTSEAIGIDNSVNAALKTELLDGSRASDAVFTVVRTDNLLSTNKLRWSARITPAAYPKTIEGEISFFNPANVVAV